MDRDPRASLAAGILASLLLCGAAPDGRVWVEIHVSDSSGRPLSGIEILGRTNGPPSILYTSAQGRAGYWARPVPAEVLLFETPVGRQELRFEVEEGQGPVEVVFPGAQVVLTVLSPVAAPQPGAFVRLRTSDRRQATTDARGQVVLRGVEPGSYALTVDAPGSAPWEGHLTVGAKDVHQTVRLEEGLKISGRLVVPAGAVLEGWRVTSSPPGGVIEGWDVIASSTSITDESGRFELLHLAAGSHQIFAEHPPKADLFFTGGSFVYRHPPRIEAPAKDVSIVIGDRPWIEGHVEYVGAPAPKALTIHAFPAPLAERMDIERGSFALLPNEQIHMVTVSAPGFIPVKTVLDQAKYGEPIEIELRAAIGFRGIVLDARGDAPIVGAKVTLGQHHPLESKKSEEPLTTETGTTGRFAFGEIDPEKGACVDVVAEGYPTASFAASGRETPVTYKLGNAYKLAGTVRLDGRPAEGALMVLRERRPKVDNTRVKVGRDGELALPLPVPLGIGQFHVVRTLEDGTLEVWVVRREVVDPIPRLSLDLDATRASVEILVPRQDGVESYPLRVTSERFDECHVFEAISVPPGARVLIFDLPKGPLSVRLTNDNMTKAQHFEVDPKHATQLRFDPIMPWKYEPPDPPVKGGIDRARKPRDRARARDR